MELITYRDHLQALISDIHLNKDKAGNLADRLPGHPENINGQIGKNVLAKVRGHLHQAAQLLYEHNDSLSNEQAQTKY